MVLCLDGPKILNVGMGGVFGVVRGIYVCVVGRGGEQGGALAQYSGGSGSNVLHEKIDLVEDEDGSELWSS